MSINFTKVSSIPALGVFLAVFCGISAVVMAYGSIKTKAPIEAKKLQNTQNALAALLPKFDNNPSENKLELTSDDGVKLNFYGAKMGGKLVGVAVETSSGKGYAGKIEAIVALNIDGTVRSIGVTKHNETPGLGSVVCERKETKTIFDLCSRENSVKESSLPPNRFLDSYNGKKMPKDGWKVRKDGGEAEYMTGATVSCRAIADLTNRAARTFQANRKEIVAKLTSNPQVAK